jgi:hypothetical protein
MALVKFVSTFWIGLQEDAFRAPIFFLCFVLLFLICSQEKVSSSQEITQKTGEGNLFFFSTFFSLLGLIFLFLLQLRLQNS